MKSRSLRQKAHAMHTPEIDMRKKLTILTLATALTFSSVSFLLPNTAYACSCVADYSQEQAFEDAEAVFVGRVLSIQEHRNTLRQLFSNDIAPSYRTIEFHVTERWKGVEKNLVTVATGFGGGDCGLYFAEGETYLVYAQEGGFYGEELATGICSRTEVSRHADADIAALGPSDTTFTDAETVYNPIDGPWWNEMQNEIADFFIQPITRTIFVAPWHVALGILSLYIAPLVVLAYWLFRKIKNKI